ncbi:MAG TPA: AAA family ATPase, partial [Pseudoneobacillus sp.]|nr:AAA family ATPase [Pseudoneobacillus sp.]
MEIIDINIYGYGKMENVKINDLHNFQVFYGLNEAGKSTIMSFIHSILFGFPTKQQNELRYEPKNHTKYGGQLIVVHPTAGKVIIERVKGKATGDVMVKFEDGTIGGEEQLAQLMKNMDKSMYQNIFSFNLNGLQNIHQVKGEDIGKFLFSAGAVGTDKLVKVENELKKELEMRFKPGGKKPILNEQIKELHDLYGKVKESQKKNEEYSLLINKKSSLDESIKNIQAELRSLQTKTNRLNEWQNLFPYVVELREIDNELEKTNNITFPSDGMKQLDTLIQMLKPLEAQLSALKDKEKRLKDKCSLIEVNESLLEHEVEVESVLTQLPIYNQLVSETAEIKHQLRNVSSKLNELMDKLHYPIDEKQLLNIETSIFMKEKVTQAHSKQFRLFDQKQMLDHRFNEEKNSIDFIEKEMDALVEQILSEQERAALGNQLKQANAREQLQKELKEVQEELIYHQTTKRTEISYADKFKGQSSFLFLFFLFLGGWSGLKQEWFLLAITGVCLVILFLFTVKKSKNIPTLKDDMLKRLHEKESQIRVQLSNTKEIDIGLVQSKIQLDEKVREQLQTTKIRHSQQQLRYEKVIQAFEEWEMETRQQKKAMDALFEALNLPKDMPFERISDAFQIIGDMKETTVEKNKLLARYKELEEKQNDIQTVMMKLAERFLPERKTSLVEMGFELKERLKEAQQNNRQYQTLLQKMDELEADYGTILKEYEYLRNEQKILFNKAGVSSEEDFRKIAMKALERDTQLERKFALEKQIQIAGCSISDFQEFKHIHQLKEQKEEWLKYYQQLEKELSKQQNDLADIKYQITLIEEGGSYSELLHRYKQKKFELEEQAKIWGTIATAKHILAKTIDRYKNERLPLLLKRAEDYFSYLTMGKYVRIHSKEGGSGFLIERNDHTFFEANELSQATMEQVYVSIRLALATTLFEKIKYPIMIDDSFVNFDEKRTKRVLELLSKIEGHQILFFTCHSHLLGYFEQDQIIQMSKSEELIEQGL